MSILSISISAIINKQQPQAPSKVCYAGTGSRVLKNPPDKEPAAARGYLTNTGSGDSIRCQFFIRRRQVTF